MERKRKSKNGDVTKSNEDQSGWGSSNVDIVTGGGEEEEKGKSVEEELK